MINTVLYNFFVSVPLAAGIWSALVLLAVVALTALITFPRRRERAAERLEIQEAAKREVVLTVKARESTRYADEVAVAAGRAAETARRRRDEWLLAQEEAEAAWQAYNDAETAARRVNQAASLPTPRTPRTPAEYADRERYLHRAAVTAWCRKELPVMELGDVLAHRNGWDPRRHPVEQEVVLRRAVRDRLLAAHQAATEREREAWHTAEMASASARSLQQEAFTAADRAYRLRHWLRPESQPATAEAPRRSGTVQRWRAVRAG